MSYFEYVSIYKPQEYPLYTPIPLSDVCMVFFRSSMRARAVAEGWERNMRGVRRDQR